MVGEFSSTRCRLYFDVAGGSHFWKEEALFVLCEIRKFTHDPPFYLVWFMGYNNE
ncbi:unnamed protein product [Pylaiella littoralis]